MNAPLRYIALQIKLFDLLWYDLGVFWLGIICLKSVAKHFFSLSILINMFRSFKRGNLCSFRPRGCKIINSQSLDSNPGSSKNSNSLCKMSVHNFAAVWASHLGHKNSFDYLFNISWQLEAQGPSMSFKGIFLRSK